VAAKILIVEDDPVWRQILHRLMKSENHEAFIASDALTALTMAQKERPDLILLDLGLPAGGGQTFLQRLRTFPKLMLIPVIIISGQELEQARATATGAAAYLKKPVSHEELLTVVRTVLQ
jgi:DNA-binding response OmpR family regulator